MDDYDCDLIPRADAEAFTGPFPLLDHEVFPIFRGKIVEVLGQAPKLYNNGDGTYGIRVSRISQNVVVKYGASVRIHEAHNMKFAAEHSKVALPRSICYIAMQYIDGDVLSEIWSGLDESVRRSVNEQLFSAISDLQSLAADRPGPVGGGLSEGAFFTHYGAGPFNSISDLESWFNERLAVCQDLGIATKVTIDLVICHMDLHMRNIILDQNQKLWLIDWSNAGFYPPYFEVAVVMKANLKDDFQDFLKAMPMETWKEKIKHLFAIGFALTTGAFCKPRNQNPC